MTRFSSKTWALGASFAVLAAMMSVLGCASAPGTGPAIALALSSPTIAVGGTAQATATSTNNGSVVSGQTVSFVVSNPAIATLSSPTALTNESGQASVTVTGVSAGTATITATFAGQTSTVTITVTSSGAGTTTVTLALATSSVPIGDTTSATATVQIGGAPAAGEAVSFASSDTGVATVAPASQTTNASGQAIVTVTAASAGTATISATSGGITGTATITVTPAGSSAPTVTLALGTSTLTAGAATTATASVQASGSPSVGEVVTFSSSDPAVATVSAALANTDASGQATVNINAVAAGTTTILAVSGGVTATANLTVVTAPSNRLVFFNMTETQFQEAANSPSAVPTNLDLGGIFLIIGNQANGEHLLLAGAGFTTAFVRNVRTGTNTPFTPATLSIFNGLSLGSKVAAISSDGSFVVWLRNAGAGRQIVRANLDGSGEQVLLNAVVAAELPTTLAISPDGTNIGYVTAGGTVHRLLSAGGTPPVALNLNGSLGAVAVDWRDNDRLVASVNNATGTGTRGIINIPANGDPATILFNAGGTGLRSTPGSIAVDPDGNVLFEELDAGLSQLDLYRIDAPGFGSRVNIVVRAQFDRNLYSLRY